jgi:hypothetical protein
VGGHVKVHKQAAIMRKPRRCHSITVVGFTIWYSKARISV